MMLKMLLILAAVVAVGAIVWLAHARLLFPIRTGACEAITVSISAHGEAPELEMQLRGLLWLRNNGVLPCTIVVVDNGLSPEAAAAAHCLATTAGFAVSTQREN